MKVSFVILTKNSERTLKRVLDAVAAIPDLDGEVVIVDGRSSDNTTGIARSYGDKLKVAVIDDEGRGLGFARDVGWRSSDSPYVVMLDSDVVINKAFVSEATSLLEKDPIVGGVSAKLKPVIDGRGWFTVFQAKNLAIHLHLDEAVYPAEAVALHTGCTMFRRSALEKVGGFDHFFKLAKEDSDVSYRLRKAGYKLAYLPLESLHLEKARFWKTNFRYGRSYVHIYEKHPDMAPIATYKNVLLTVALFLPPVQLLVYLHYLRRYAVLKDLSTSEKIVLPFIEVLRQAVRTAGMVYQLLRKYAGLD
ncbi:MAG: glycosyltransferase [Candidatus Caldarchaeum sp.]|nr:glycosyltransferase [Candidatus Caldarchaeum sp.]